MNAELMKIRTRARTQHREGRYRLSSSYRRSEAGKRGEGDAGRQALTHSLTRKAQQQLQQQQMQVAPQQRERAHQATKPSGGGELRLLWQQPR